MTIENKQGLYKQQGLTQAELDEIGTLASLCEAYEHLHMKLNWNTLHTRPKNQTNDFLYYENGVLIGFLAFFSFNPIEAEVSGMVHPEHRRRHVFTQLFSAAYEECQHRNIPTLLLIVEHNSASGQGFAAALKPKYQHSEYKMELAEVKTLPELDAHLLFRQATLNDVPILVHITAISFALTEQDVDWYTTNRMQNEKNKQFLATLDGVPIGKLDISLEVNEAYISGFGVLPPFRGRGYGRQILAQAIREILMTGQNRVVLEVATDNKNALSLYQLCGFREVSSYDYYSLPM